MLILGSVLMARYLVILVTVFLKVLLCNSVHAEKPNFIIILTDDQGWADFSANQVDGSLKTPNLDRLVQSGVNFTNGYTCAPQCIPARAGLLLGKAQNRIGIERNGDSLEPFSQEANLAELLSENGYSCAMIGKWHLGPGNEIQNHGFRFFYNQVAFAPFWANFSEKGALSGAQKIGSSSYHINGCSKTARSFISEHAQEPFFLFLSYRAPHVPLDCPERYLSKFSNKLPAARRQALVCFRQSMME